MRSYNFLAMILMHWLLSRLPRIDWRIQKFVTRSM